MFSNFRRNFYIVLVLFLILLFTDTGLENSARLWFLNTFGLDAGGAISVTDYLTTFQHFISGIVNNLSSEVTQNSLGTTGIMSVVWMILGWVMSLLKIIVTNTLFFFVAIIVLVYFILTSRLFRNKYDY